MQKPLHERSYGGKPCPNHGKRYGELLKTITWFYGKVDRCCCFSQPFGIVQPRMHCVSIRRMWINWLPKGLLVLPKGLELLPKGLELLPRGLEYALLTTELASKTCHDTGPGKQRLCLRNNLSRVSWFNQMSIDNQIDNLAITKNCQKGPRTARDLIQSLEWR